MLLRMLFYLCLLLLLISCEPAASHQDAKVLQTKIAFGSCGHEDAPLPIFNNVVQHDPDLFIFLGDNIYGDTKVMDTLRAKYQRLADHASFQNLKREVPIIATWDDHDYGWNDVGKEYEFKAASKEIFLEFFEEAKDSPRRKHQGIYHAEYYDYGAHRLQVILLDGRTFRDPLKAYAGEFDQDRRFGFYRNDYGPHTDASTTFLGAQQWAWLENELRQKADIRLIASGTQFGIEWNGYEAWANYPHEQQRMVDLIAKTKANGVIFISGDVHYSEISKLETEAYPIYDFTSSGLSSTWYFATPNKNRIEGPIMDNHFGLITIDWLMDDPKITMETWDINDNQRIEYRIALKEISF